MPYAVSRMPQAVCRRPPLRPLHCLLAKSCYFSKIFDPASVLLARSLPATALLALRRRHTAYGIRLRLCRAASLR
ncbi:MAG: hypothetical protein ACR2L2_16075 [Acidobacteriota bacterium]